DAGSAESVPGPALGRAAGSRIAEYVIDRRVLGAIVGGRSRSVQVDIVDVLRRYACARERRAHGQMHARPIRAGCRHVVAVRAFPITQEQDPRGPWTRALEQDVAGRFTDRDAVALRIPRPARLARQ